MTLYIAIALISLVCAGSYWISHTATRPNVRQIIFTTLTQGSYTTTISLQKKLGEYEIKISRITLRLVLWYLTVKGYVERSPRGWKNQESRPSVAFRLPAS